MTNDALQQLWKCYLDSYADVPTAERERLLRLSVSDDIVFSNPTGEEGRGFGNLVEHVSQFQKTNPGGYFTSNRLFSHHHQLLSEWTMHKKDGTDLVTAHTYGRFNEQGLLTQTTGFWKV